MIAKINHDYFSEENIKKYPERLVIVGFIAADGCVSILGTGQKRLVFNICQKDKMALDIINKKLSNRLRHLSFNKTTKSYTITFTSDKICADLERYNIVPHKTATYDLPQLENQQMSYFLRGYFYGDGCIYYNKKRNGCFLIGNKFFMNSLKSYLIDNCILEKCNLYTIKDSEYMQMRMYGRMAARFSKFIFLDRKIVLLPRKHHIIEEKITNEWTVKEKQLLASMDIDSFCELTNRKKKSVILFKWRMSKSSSPDTYGTRVTIP